MDAEVIYDARWSKKLRALDSGAKHYMVASRRASTEVPVYDICIGGTIAWRPGKLLQSFCGDTKAVCLSGRNKLRTHTQQSKHTL